MNMLRKIALAGSLAALATATPALADAITFDATSIGESFTVSYDGFADGQQIAGLSGDATFTLTAIDANSYTFDYSLSNTSGGGVDSRISSFAFNVDPDISSATSTGTFSNTVLNKNYPNGIGTVDVCFKGGGSNACGGNSGGVTNGNTGTGTLSLTFDGGAPAPITLSDFFLRYQSISGAGNVTSASGSGSITSSGGTPPGSTTGGTEVPEPGMLGLLGVGLIGIGLMRSRRRKQLRQPLPA